MIKHRPTIWSLLQGYSAWSVTTGWDHPGARVDSTTQRTCVRAGGSAPMSEAEWRGQGERDRLRVDAGS